MGVLTVFIPCSASFDNLVGFYLADKTTRAVVDRLTGDSIAELGDRNAYEDGLYYPLS